MPKKRLTTPLTSRGDVRAPSSARRGAVDGVSVQQAFATFLEYTPPARLSRNLRNMLLLYLMYEKDGV